MIREAKLDTVQFGIFNSFFRSRMGRSHSFRVRDPSDCNVSMQRITFSPGGNKIKPIKIYSDPVRSYVRRIDYPIKETIKLHINGRLVNHRYEQNGNNIIVPNSLMETDIVTCSFDFDVITRFDSDDFQYSYEKDGSILLQNVQLVEVI
jgi:uncharacterized protein (TIGR02217 family)